MSNIIDNAIEASKKIDNGYIDINESLFHWSCLSQTEL